LNVYSITTNKQKGVVFVKNNIIVDAPDIWKTFKFKDVKLLFRWVRSIDKDFKINEK